MRADANSQKSAILSDLTGYNTCNAYMGGTLTKIEGYVQVDRLISAPWNMSTQYTCDVAILGFFFLVMLVM